MLLIIILCVFTAFLRTGTALAVVETNSVIGNFPGNVSTSLKEVEKEIESLVKSFSKIALPYFIRNSDSNVSSSCMSALMHMFMDFRKLKLPVIKMLDAMAKPPSGILKGGFSIMGDYDECLEVKVNQKGDKALTEAEEVYHGHYCMVEIELPPAIVNGYIDLRNKKVNASTLGKIGQFLDELPKVNFAGNYYTFKVGICMPSTCSIHDLQELLKLVPLQFFPMRVKYCDDGRIQQLNIGQAMFIGFIILLGIFVVSGTIFQMRLYMEPTEFKEYKKLVQFLLAFSIYGNTKKLMKLEKNSTSYQIPSINGMYVIGSLFVIIYHTYFMPFFMTFSRSLRMMRRELTTVTSWFHSQAADFYDTGLQKLIPRYGHGYYLGKSMNDWKFTIMSTMGVSIDAYFLFSGILMIYPRYKREGKQAKVNIFKIIFRRYLRFCPSMLVILGIMVSLPLIGSGPVWPEIFGVAAENTRKWWWTYVLMFNNFLEVKDQSFFPFWFIPCLMQITVIGAVLLWFISKNPNFGMFLTAVTCLSCNIALGLLTHFRNYPMTYALYYYDKREHIERTIYTSPLSHVSSYGIGLLLGYFMAKNSNLKLSRVHVVLGWICSLFFIIGTQLFCYIGHEGQDLNPTLTAVYAATHRTLYSLGMSWIVLACTYGYGGVLAEFLSWKGFGVLAKLSYSGYLLHYIVIAYHVSFTRVPLSFSHYEIFMRFCGYATVTTAASYLLYVTFELPMSYVESLLLPRRLDLHMNGNLKENGALDESKLRLPMWYQQKSSKAEVSKL